MDEFKIPEGAVTAPMYSRYPNAEQRKRLHDAAARARRRHPFARRKITEIVELSTKHVGEGLPDEVVDALVELVEGGLKDSKQAKQAHREARRRK